MPIVAMLKIDTTVIIIKEMLYMSITYFHYPAVCQCYNLISYKLYQNY